MIYFVAVILFLIVIGFLFQADEKKNISVKELDDRKRDLYFYTEMHSSISIPSEINWNEKSQKWHVPKGKITSELDLTFFPPNNYKEQEPVKGVIATIWQDPIKKLAVITEVKKGGKEIIVQPEYYTGHTTFTLRKDGNYKEKHGSATLYVGIEESNYVEYKQWYSRTMLSQGPIKGTDVRNYLPHNWEEYYNH